MVSGVTRLLTREHSAISGLAVGIADLDQHLIAVPNGAPRSAMRINIAQVQTPDD